MADPASASPAPDGQSAREALAALDQHIKELRRDLADTLDLIERLQASCLTLHTKLAAAEREHARLMAHLN